MLSPKTRRVTGILILMAAYAALLPGLTLPMLGIEGDVDKRDLIEVGRQILDENRNDSPLLSRLGELFIDQMHIRGSVSAFAKTNSILGTARELYDSANVTVAVLIVVFSVVVPAVKLLLLLFAALPVQPRWRQTSLVLADLSSKWSMADVFVIAIFLAYLAGNGLAENSGLVKFHASLGEGFWYFLSYCLLSIAGSMLLRPSLSKSRSFA